MIVSILLIVLSSVKCHWAPHTGTCNAGQLLKEPGGSQGLGTAPHSTAVECLLCILGALSV